MARLKLVHLSPHANNEFWEKLEPAFSPYHRGGLEKGLRQAGFDPVLIDNRGQSIQHGTDWPDMLLQQLKSVRPDIIMISDNAVRPVKVLRLKELFPETFIFFYYYDQDPAQFRLVSNLGKVCDCLFLNNQDPTEWRMYTENGVENICCWHQGVDPNVYYPLHYNLDRCDFDLIFMGTDKVTQSRYLDYPHRLRQFLVYNTAWRYKTLVVGRWWDPKKLSFYLPRAFEAEANYQMSRARMILGVQNYPYVVGSTSNRTWLSLATGRLYLCTKFAGIESMFTSRQHLVWYTDIYELFDLIDYYRRHPNLCNQIGRQGRQLIEARHTYFHRAQELKAIYRHWKKGTLKTLNSVI